MPNVVHDLEHAFEGMGRTGGGAVVAGAGALGGGKGGSVSKQHPEQSQSKNIVRSVHVNAGRSSMHNVTPLGPLQTFAHDTGKDIAHLRTRRHQVLYRDLRYQG